MNHGRTIKAEDNKPIFRRLYERVFPTVADFFGMLAEQSANAAETTRLLVEFMETGDVAVSQKVRDDEHEADRIKAANLSVLERRLLDAGRSRRPLPRDHDARRHRELLQIDRRRDGHAGPATRQAQPAKSHCTSAKAPTRWPKVLARLATDPAGAGVDANAARKAERTVEKSYRRAITALFQGDDYLNMFKRRETYRHLSNAADRVADAARALDNIVVKLC
jgi:hypothetical protein